MSRFEAIRENTRAIIARSFKLRLSVNLGVLFDALPTVGALPRYLAGEITFGGVTRIVGGFHGVTNNLNYFTQVYDDFTTLLALANRLRDLVWAINKAQDRASGFTIHRADQPGVSSRPLQLRTPMDAVMADVAPLRLLPANAGSCVGLPGRAEYAVAGVGRTVATWCGRGGNVRRGRLDARRRIAAPGACPRLVAPAGLRVPRRSHQHAGRSHRGHAVPGIACGDAPLRRGQRGPPGDVGRFSRPCAGHAPGGRAVRDQRCRRAGLTARTVRPSAATVPGRRS
jgi:hypothetical protein